MAPRRSASLRGGLLTSLLLHGVAGLILLPLTQARPLPAPAETSINVEIVSSPPADAVPQPAKNMTPPSALPLSAPSPLPLIDDMRFAAPEPSPGAKPPQNAPSIPAPAQPGSPATASPAPGSKRIRPGDMLSGKILADPRSRDAVRQLRQLAATDQIEQLCNVEAMEQVHRWKSSYVPEFVVAYAKADTVQSPHEIDAPGAAFLSAKHWYEISFHCVVTPDLTKVTGFDFEVGPEIPPEKWADYSLFASSKAQD